MYLDIAYKKVSGRVYRRVLLRTSYREGNRVKHRTIANLSKCSDEEIKAIKLSLKHKKQLPKLEEQIEKNNLTAFPQMTHVQSVGAVFLLFAVAKRLGIHTCLGNNRQGLLALWQILGFWCKK